MKCLPGCVCGRHSRVVLACAPGCMCAKHGCAEGCKCGRHDQEAIRLASQGQKQCGKCRSVQPLAQFARRGEKRRQAWCRTCGAKDKMVRRLANPGEYNEYMRTYRQSERGQDSYLRRTYGITLDRYRELLAQQAGCCAICRTANLRPGTGRLAVDHEEVDGVIRVRGILCDACNSGIGLLRHDSTLLRRAIRYLQQ